MNICEDIKNSAVPYIKQKQKEALKDEFNLRLMRLIHELDKERQENNKKIKEKVKRISGLPWYRRMWHALDQDQLYNRAAYYVCYLDIERKWPLGKQDLKIRINDLMLGQLIEDYYERGVTIKELLIEL